MMMKHPLGALVSGLLIAAALSLASGANAQAPAPKAESPKPAMMAEHHTDKGVWVEHGTDMMKECRTMMAKHQEMQGKLQAMEGKLDGLVAAMNAAGASEVPGAMEKPMAAVITELVAQRNTTRSMMMEMQPEMMAHMMHHGDMHGAKGGMDCPMMKAGKTEEPMAGEPMVGESGDRLDGIGGL